MTESHVAFAMLTKTIVIRVAKLEVMTLVPSEDEKRRADDITHVPKLGT